MSTTTTTTTKTRKTIEEYLTTFKKGTAVEVSSNDEGLRGSWYTATVLKPINPTTLKIQVEYHNLLAHSHGPKKLVEQVDAVLIRPIQPLDPARVFRLMDDVDAYHNDGWWEGVVTRVYDNKTRYSVFFRCSREQIDFDSTDLRLHREWLPPGFWVPPFDYWTPNLSSGHKRKMGESRTNGDHSAGGNSQKMRKVEVRAVERKSLYTLGKHGGMVLMKNGGESGTNGGHSAGGNGQKMGKVEVREVEKKSLYSLSKQGGSMVLMKNGGESGTNGGHSAGGNGQKMRKVEVRAVEKKSLYSPSKQGGSMVLMKNGGESGTNGGHSAGGNGQKMRKVEVEKKSLYSPSKQGGSMVLMKNGGGFGNSNHSVSVVMGRNQRICSNGVHSESGVSRNVTSKDPRKKAANHTSGGGSRK